MARCCATERAKTPLRLVLPPEGPELYASPLRSIEEHLLRIEDSMNLKFKELQNDIAQNGIVVNRIDQVDQKLQELSRVLAEASQQRAAAVDENQGQMKAVDKEAEQSANRKSRENRQARDTRGSGSVDDSSVRITKAESVAHHEAHTWYDKNLVMNPRSRFAHVWSFLVAMAVVYVCFDVPFQIGFSWWRKPQLQGTFDAALEVFFWIDMAQSFRTGFEHDGHLVMQLKEIAKHYLEMWFWVDFVANFPWETVIGHLMTDKKQRKSIKGFKWLKLSKLLRLTRWVKIINTIGGGVGHIVNLSVQVAWILMSVHCTACTLMLFRDPCSDYPPVDDVWKYAEKVDESMVLADLSLGVRCLQSHVFPQYGETLHSAAAVVIGASRCLYTYTDVLEGGIDAWLFVNLVMWQLLGIFFIGRLFSHLAKNTLMQNSRESLFWLQQDAAKNELEQHGANFSDHLIHRIKKRFKLRFQKSDYGPLQLLSDNLLPKSLRLELAMAHHGRRLRDLDAFRNAPPGLLPCFCLALRSERYLAEEFIYRCGEMVTGLKIVSEGTVTGLSADERLLWTAEENQIFGVNPRILELQDPFSEPHQHKHHARSVTQTTVKELPLEDLQSLFRQYPDFMEGLVKDGSIGC